MNNIPLIKTLNDSLKPKDPVQEAIDSVDDPFNPTHLDDEQVEMLADYMKEMIDFSKKRGQPMSVEDAAGMALEDVAGFEGAPKAMVSATVKRLAQVYVKKFGA